MKIDLLVFPMHDWKKCEKEGFRTRDARFKNLSIFIMSAVSVILINGLVGSAVEAFPINFIVWFFMGALVKLYSIEKGTGIKLTDHEV